MNCKNCGSLLSEDAKYCPDCGAEVVRERMTLKKMIKEGFAETLGWDIGYLKTFRYMAVSPELVIQSYVDGTRKKFMNPFKFMFLGVALSIIIFGFFAGEFGRLSMSSSNIINEYLYQAMGFDDEMIASLKASNAELGGQMLKYLNLIYMINLPIYALMSRFSIPKRFNYSEHLILNAYVQGFTFALSIIFFFISLLSKNTLVYNLSLLAMMSFYVYVLVRLFKLSFLQSVWAVVRFLISCLLFLLAMIVLGAVAGAIGYAIGSLIGQFG